jgi:hypothetical protein
MHVIDPQIRRDQLEMVIASTHRRSATQPKNTRPKNLKNAYNKFILAKCTVPNVFVNPIMESRNVASDVVIPRSFAKSIMNTKGQ